MEHRRPSPESGLRQRRIVGAKLDDPALCRVHRQHGAEIGQIDDREAARSQEVPARLLGHRTARAAKVASGFRVRAEDDADAARRTPVQVPDRVEQDRQRRKEVLIAGHDQASGFAQRGGDQSAHRSRRVVRPDLAFWLARGPGFRSPHARSWRSWRKSARSALVVPNPPSGSFFRGHEGRRQGRCGGSINPGSNSRTPPDALGARAHRVRTAPGMGFRPPVPLAETPFGRKANPSRPGIQPDGWRDPSDPAAVAGDVAASFTARSRSRRRAVRDRCGATSASQIAISIAST